MKTDISKQEFEAYLRKEAEKDRSFTKVLDILWSQCCPLASYATEVLGISNAHYMEEGLYSTKKEYHGGYYIIQDKMIWESREWSEDFMKAVDHIINSAENNTSRKTKISAKRCLKILLR
jgi:hypothetical protein